MSRVLKLVSWNLAYGKPGGFKTNAVHIHYVVQPVTAEQMAEHDAHGPRLQVAMFAAGHVPAAEDVERVAEQARRAFGQAPSGTWNAVVTAVARSATSAATPEAR